jgi:hypothetical protein
MSGKRCDTNGRCNCGICRKRLWPARDNLAMIRVKTERIYARKRG